MFLFTKLTDNYMYVIATYSINIWYVKYLIPLNAVDTISLTYII